MYLVVLAIITIALVVFIYLLFSYSKKKVFEDEQEERARNLVLFLIKVPQEQKTDADEQPKDQTELISKFEQFLASIHSIYEKGIKRKFTGQDHISLEIVAKEKEIYFYVGCRKSIASMVEKQIHAQYPNASIVRIKDFHLFNKSQKALAGGTIKQKDDKILPILTYQELEGEPLNALTNSLSKLREKESASVQIIIRPVDNSWREEAEKKSRDIVDGKSLRSGDYPKFIKYLKKFFKFLGEAYQIAKNSGENKGPDKPDKPDKLTAIQENQINKLQEKASKLGFKTQIRIVTAAENKQQAELHLNNIASAFAQFASAEFNQLEFKKIKEKELDPFIRNYILRKIDYGEKDNLLNSEEIASLFHLPNQYVETPNISWLRTKEAPPPSNLPEEGIIIGQSHYRGEEKMVRIKEDDRRRHIYSIGKTGVGKTTFMEKMIVQDIKNGKGVGVIDPHGDLIESILTKIPKERGKDVILVDPSDIQRPMGINLLDWNKPEEKDFLVQEAISIFYKLFDPTGQGFIGPQFEHWMRNAALTLMEQPSGGTLIEIPRLFTDKSFEKEAVSNIDSQAVKAFWTKQMAQTSDYHKSEMLNYFVSKFGRFMTNDMMRNIMGQRKSAFNLREVMDSGKILLVNLSKGKMGEVNSNLIGMILVSKLQMAAMSRADIPEDERTDFYLYVDEFQNFATDSFAEILSEARKYHLNLTIANQYVAQLEEEIRDAVFGNVGTLSCFRIGAQDAEFVGKEFEPTFTQNDLLNIDKYHAYIRLIIDKTPTKPFNIETVLDETEPDKKLAEQIRQYSRLKYGRAKEIVDKETNQPDDVYNSGATKADPFTTEGK
jgi:hypothetical protein